MLPENTAEIKIITTASFSTSLIELEGSRIQVSAAGKTLVELVFNFRSVNSNGANSKLYIRNSAGQLFYISDWGVGVGKDQTMSFTASEIIENKSEEYWIEARCDGGTTDIPFAQLIAKTTRIS